MTRVGGPLGGLSVQQTGAIAEAGHDIVAVLSSGLRLRAARTQPDDHGLDRLMYAADAPDRVLLVNPKGASAVQDGHFWTFRVVMDAIPRDASRYFVTLCPLQAESPWIGKWVWVVPGEAVRARAGNSKYKMIQVPAEPSATNPWERYRVPRSGLGRHYLGLLGAPRTPRAAGGSHERSRSAAAFLLETAQFCHLTVASRGLLHVWRPFVDVQGVDQSVNFAGNPAFLMLQPKGVLGRTARGLIQAHLEASTFHPSPHSFVVVGEMDPPTMAQGEFTWLIPTEAISEHVGRSRGAFVWTVSPDPAAKRGEFLQYRHATRDFPHVVATTLAVLSRDGPRAELPASRDEIRRAQASLLRPRASALPASGFERLAALHKAAGTFRKPS